MPSPHIAGRSLTMDLKQLSAMIAVAEEGSVTGAARRLRLVQPAVSRQIRALETELGVDLFTRTRTGMDVTPAGEVMVERARRAIAELERARSELQPHPHDVTGTVSVGLLESMSDLLAEPLVSAVREAHPHVQLRVLTAYSGHLRSWLDAGDLDLALLYNLRQTTSFNVQPVGREQLWAIAPPDAGLHVGKPVPLTDLTRVPLVLPEPGHGLRVLIDQAFAHTGRRPNVVAETNSMRIQKALVLHRHGWTILPEIGAAADVVAGLLSGAPLDPHVNRTIALVSREHERVSAPVRAVAAQLRRCIAAATMSSQWSHETPP